MENALFLIKKRMILTINILLGTHCKNTLSNAGTPLRVRVSSLFGREGPLFFGSGLPFSRNCVFLQY